MGKLKSICFYSEVLENLFLSAWIAQARSVSFSSVIPCILPIYTYSACHPIAMSWKNQLVLLTTNNPGHPQRIPLWATENCHLGRDKMAIVLPSQSAEPSSTL